MEALQEQKWTIIARQRVRQTLLTQTLGDVLPGDNVLGSNLLACLRVAGT